MQVNRGTLTPKLSQILGLTNAPESVTGKVFVWREYLSLETVYDDSTTNLSPLKIL